MVDLVNVSENLEVNLLSSHRGLTFYIKGTIQSIPTVWDVGEVPEFHDNRGSSQLTMQLNGFNPEEEMQNFMVRILILTAALHYYKESAL